MRTSACFVHVAVAAAIILVIALCMVQCVGRTNDYRGSRWTGGYEEFVADVGTATVTMVLVLSMEDGTEMELRREDDSLVGETPFGEEVVFRKGE